MVLISGIIVGTDFIPVPDISLNVEPEAIPSIVGRRFFSKKYTYAVPIFSFGTTDLNPWLVVTSF